MNMKRVIIPALMIILLIPLVSAGFFDWFTGNAATTSLSDQQQAEWVSQGSPIKITVNSQEHELNIIDVTDSKDTCGVSVDGYFAWIKIGEDEKVNGILIGIKDAQTSSGNVQDVDKCFVTFSGSPLTKTGITSDNAQTATVTDSISATKTGTQAPINTNLCVEAIPGHNNINENRINVVFVGINYNELAYIKNPKTGGALRPVSNKDSFIAYVKEIIDPDQKSMFGILSVEPFKSNKDKFNFWYVDEIGRVENFQEGEITGGGNYYGVEADKGIKILGDACSVRNKEIITLINWRFRSNAISPIAKISLQDNYPQNITSDRIPNCNMITTIHELGHSIGYLMDEYLPGGSEGVPFFFPTLNHSATIGMSSFNCSNEGVCAFVDPTGNCFYSTNCQGNNCSSTPASMSDCEKNAEWRDLIGNGCGQDGVIDCKKPTCTQQEDSTQINCYGGDDNYHLEVSCQNLGCTYPNLYRSSPITIMRQTDMQDNDILLEFLHGNKERSFGPNNERLICRRIRNQTGSVGDICDELCLDGCPDGQRCIKGACQNLGSITPTPTNDTSCICPAIYNPVCGTDGKTYSNSCEAKCSNVNIKSQGECLKPVNKCDGCLTEKSQCLPYGTRVSNSYCSLDKRLTAQKGSNRNCKNNFECNSNLCISDKCVSKSIFDRFLAFFKRFF